MKPIHKALKEIINLSTDLTDNRYWLFIDDDHLLAAYHHNTRADSRDYEKIWINVLLISSRLTPCYIFE